MLSTVLALLKPYFVISYSVILSISVIIHLPCAVGLYVGEMIVLPCTFFIPDVLIPMFFRSLLHYDTETWGSIGQCAILL